MLRTVLRSTPLISHSITSPVSAYTARRFTSKMAADKVVHVHNKDEYEATLKKDGLVCENQQFEKVITREGEDG